MNDLDLQDRSRLRPVVETTYRREEYLEYVPEDMVYVHNFNDPDQPRLLRFPAGQGREFAAAMAELVSGLGR